MTLFNINETKLVSSLFISAVILALFYTGNNVWLFSSSYILLTLSFALVLKQRFHQAISISINGILISASLLLLWFALSIFTSQIMYLSLYNFFWLGSLIIVFLIFTLSNNKDNIWNTIWPALLLLVLLWSVYGLVQYFYLHVPPSATFLNRNSLAALINLALIPTSGYFLLNENQRPWAFLNNKILSLALILLFFTTFIITSRGATLSLLLGYIVMVILLWKHINKSQLYALFTIIIISFFLTSLSQYFIQDLPSGFTERMATIQNTSSAGRSRFILWESLIPLFKEMPWYGLGLGSLWVFWAPYRPANDPSAGFFAHNDYMQITLEAGYPGIVLLISLFIFILISFIRRLKRSHESTPLSLLQRVELISLFAALLTFSAHSFFTYNFYILPLLLIAGIYLARINQLTITDSQLLKTMPAIKIYFKPIMFFISLCGLIIIFSAYFIGVSLSSQYNTEAKRLMVKNQFQKSNAYFIKAQAFAPLMDNPFFSHADLLRRGANKLIGANKNQQAIALLTLAHNKLNTAERLNPLRPQSFHIRGLIYQDNQPEKAKVEFETALKLNPRFLFSRIRLATLLYQQNQLKEAINVLYEGINYHYPVDKAMLEYMTLFARLSREAGVKSFALHLESNIKKIFNRNNP